MGAIINRLLLIRACRCHILLSSCTIAVFAIISVGVLNFGKFQGGLGRFKGGLSPP